MEVNAFALPGGFIYLNRGLIERMESLDQLAGVLGHEIGHVVRRHSVERMEKAGRANVGVSLVCSLTEWCQSQSAQVAINVAGSAWLARHSRADEAEADSVAVITVLLAGISPGGVASMFQVLLAERQAQPTFVDAWFGTHPLEESRIERSRQHIALIEPAALEGLLEDTPEFQQMRARLSMLPPPPPPPARLAPR
jgi:predicted Zn-dependent protease